MKNVIVLVLSVAMHSFGANADSDDLRKLFDEEREAFWREYPLIASLDGVKTYDDRLDSRFRGRD